MKKLEKRSTDLTLLVLASVLFGMFILPGCDPETNEIVGDERSAQVQYLFQYVPDDDYVSLGFADIDALASSSWVQELISFSPMLEVWDTKLGVSINLFHQMIFVTKDEFKEGVEPPAMIILESDLDDEQIQNLIADKRHYMKIKKVGDFKLHVVSDEFSFAVLDRGIVAIGTTSLVKQAIKLRQGNGASLLKKRGFGKFERYLSSPDDFWVGIEGIDRVIRNVSKEVTMFRNFDVINFVYLGFKASEDLEGQMIAECDTEKNAGRIARGLSGMLGIAGTLVNTKGLEVGAEIEEMPVSPEEIRSMLQEFFNRIDITHDQERVFIKYAVPRTMLDFFINSYRKAMKEMNNLRLPDDLDKDAKVSVDNP